MIAIDLVKIKRFKKVKNELLNRFLHPEEIAQYSKLNKQKKALFLSTRWALKECILKIDNSFFEFRKILINKTNEGRYVYQDFMLSTTNEDGYVVAVAFRK